VKLAKAVSQNATTPALFLCGRVAGGVKRWEAAFEPLRRRFILSSQKAAYLLTYAACCDLSAIKIPFIAI